MILDAYNIIQSGIRDGVLKYGLMEDYETCLHKVSEFNTNNNDFHVLLDRDGIRGSKEVEIRTKFYKKDEEPQACTNQHHLSCSKCDNNLHSGMGSMAIAQALSSLICS